MIELSASTALMLYLCVTLLFLMVFWLYYHYRVRRQRFFPLEKQLHQCEFCHYAYLEESEKHVTRCPRCHSFNNHF